MQVRVGLFDAEYSSTSWRLHPSFSHQPPECNHSTILYMLGAWVKVASALLQTNFCRSASSPAAGFDDMKGLTCVGVLVSVLTVSVRLSPRIRSPGALGSGSFVTVAINLDEYQPVHVLESALVVHSDRGCRMKSLCRAFHPLQCASKVALQLARTLIIWAPAMPPLTSGLQRCAKISRANPPVLCLS